ncbi:O-methyltransferase involved in polyketide biosynthesis [Tamaricihabitans halophyticus]|uniref:O-methyltransferase involved in polyketide biosynthesis n=1 Tax=Tamaricihabitans halophyticus TaxID=1262583 RepID=A0A4V2SUF4_9PSEU|nr:class I SAM-dependent methyltransferase [Tamaricihabitans halophyticus]TCP54106.1 O-methyltransferase involved in polyketide biosynthesis [Tamaricihabitans halophyticus]
MVAEKVRLSEDKETLLASLYGRAIDSRDKDPILCDRIAADVLNRIDYDFSKTKINNAEQVGEAMRARQLDDWVVEFLAEYPDATVVNLGCGLDTRVFRLGAAPIVRWHDVDLPEIVEVRKQLYSPRDGCKVIGTKPGADGWLEKLPTDRPAVLVMDNASALLTEDEGRQLIQRFTTHFLSGQLLLGACNTRGLRQFKHNFTTRGTDAAPRWAIDNPQELESLHPRLDLVDQLSGCDMPRQHKLPLWSRLAARLTRRSPSRRNSAMLLRYRF